ncbi:hypothetical protein ACHAWF_015334 [Thalassiosira exigua]
MATTRREWRNLFVDADDDGGQGRGTRGGVDDRGGHRGRDSGDVIDRRGRTTRGGSGRAADRWSASPGAFARASPPSRSPRRPESPDSSQAKSKPFVVGHRVKVALVASSWALLTAWCLVRLREAFAPDDRGPRTRADDLPPVLRRHETKEQLEHARRGYDLPPVHMRAGTKKRPETKTRGYDLPLMPKRKETKLEREHQLESERRDYDLRHEAQHHLNDRTIRLSPHISRPWLYRRSNVLSVDAKDEMALPTKKLVLTDFGWNHLNATKGLSFSRSMRSREILRAFADREDFDPTFQWSEMAMEEVEEGLEEYGKIGFDPSLDYVVMLDVETCFESNYPLSVGDFGRNADTQGGRHVGSKYESTCYGISGCHHYINAVLTSPLFKKARSASLVYFECGGAGFHAAYRKSNPDPNLFIFSLSSSYDVQHMTKSDFGLPPPALNPVTLSHDQRLAVDECDESDRPYTFTFVGSGASGIRRDLFNLHNGRDVLLMKTAELVARKNLGELDETYETLMARSVFSGAPRGDCLFSYRFAEVLSSGAIPVIHADGWVLPYHEDVVDWSKCVVMIPEAIADKTLDVLKRIGAKRRCEMRRYCRDVYQRYVVNPEAVWAGVLDSVDAARRKYARGSDDVSSREG